MPGIILFDGVCNLCNHSVQFIINRDRNHYFKFASLQSETGKLLIEKHNIGATVKSVVLIEEDRSYLKSTAALRIGRHLSGPWRFFTIFLAVPKPIRDVLYDFVARNRYRWFGKRDSCMLPSKGVKDRFLP